MKLGMLTGGGDCPGLNPAIRAAVMRATDYGDELIGFKQGWKGVIENDAISLMVPDVEDIIRIGGTMLESSRTNPLKKQEDLDACLATIKDQGLDGVIAIGGEDTLGVANKLCGVGVPAVGVPKTMDNDIKCTDYTFGFDSAVAVAVDAADRLRDTARSHRRCMVLEVMGRHAGWVALHTAIAGGADWVTLPEVPLNLDEIAGHLESLRQRGRHHALLVVSEGTNVPEVESETVARDAFGHILLKERGVGDFIAQEVEHRTSFSETRVSVLGHIIRGGAPTPFDRWLASRLAIKAVDLAHEGTFGTMASLRASEIVAVPLEDAVNEWKLVPRELYDEVKALFK
jgi:phosphofructokinase-like protein